MTMPLDSDLGRLAAPPSTAPFDGIRLSMLDVLISGRQAHPDGHQAWQAAWEHAATAIRDAVLSDARAAIRSAAIHSRYPGRRLAALDPDDETADILRNRLLAEGMPLEQFEAAPANPELDRRRGAALEQAWYSAVRVASGDLARWRSIAAQVAAWRRPMRLFWALAGLATASVVLVAAWLGGQLPAPSWFRPVHQWWWSLPWP